MLSCIYRQNSKVLKIIYTKTWVEVMKGMMNSRYRDRVTDGQRYGRSGEDMMNIMQKERRQKVQEIINYFIFSQMPQIYRLLMLTET